MVILPVPVTPVPLPQCRLTSAQKQEAERVKTAAKITERAAKEEAKVLKAAEHEAKVKVKEDT